MTKYPKISITLRDSVLSAIDARGGERSSEINQELERYHAIIENATRKLRQLLSDDEIAMILDVLNGTAFADTLSIGFVYAEIEDSISDGYAEKWHIDGHALAEKLKLLTYGESAALVDCVERWWNRVGNGEQPSFADALK